MVLTAQKTIVILQLQFIDKVFDVSVVQVQQVRVQSVRRQSSSHSCSSLLRGHCRAHARRCATTNGGWFRRQKTVKSPQLVLLLDKGVDVPVLATSRGCRGSAVAVHRLVW